MTLGVLLKADMSAACCGHYIYEHLLSGLLDIPQSSHHKPCRRDNYLSMTPKESILVSEFRP